MIILNNNNYNNTEISHFESHFEFFLFKFNFLEFCNNCAPDFENLCYLLHLNTSDSIKKNNFENSESKQGCSKNLCKNACAVIVGRA